MKKMQFIIITSLFLLIFFTGCDDAILLGDNDPGKEPEKPPKKINYSMQVTMNEDIIVLDETCEIPKVRINKTGVPVVFKITNDGEGILKLTGNPIVQKGGDILSEFIVNQSSIKDLLSPGETTEFQVSFTAKELSVKTINLSISNNSNINNFTFSINTEGVNPGVEVYDDKSKEIQSNSSINIAETMMIYKDNTDSTSNTFTIKNGGSDSLSINGVYLSGDTADFNVSSQPVLNNLNPVGNAGDETTFSIDFKPITEGSKKVIVNLLTDDPNMESLKFNISGVAERAYPNIVLKEGTEQINHENTIDFTPGSQICIQESSTEKSKTKTFTITNNGNDKLDINDIYISSGDMPDFNIDTNISNTTLSSGESTTCDITFLPKTSGYKNITVNISSDDNDTPIFKININGKANKIITGTETYRNPGIYTFTFPDNIKGNINAQVDVIAAGGGGGGGFIHTNSYNTTRILKNGGGGFSGYTHIDVALNNYFKPDVEYTILVGEGGRPGTDTYVHNGTTQTTGASGNSGGISIIRASDNIPFPLIPFPALGGVKANNSSNYNGLGETNDAIGTYGHGGNGSIVKYEGGSIVVTPAQKGRNGFVEIRWEGYEIE